MDLGICETTSTTEFFNLRHLICQPILALLSRVGLLTFLGGSRDDDRPIVHHFDRFGNGTLLIYLILRLLHDVIVYEADLLRLLHRILKVLWEDRAILA